MSIFNFFLKKCANGTKSRNAAHIYVDYAISLFYA